MNYTIKQVSQITGLSIPTLRYYDKENLFPKLERKDSNYRIFTEAEIEIIKVIRCFKKAGLEIKEMKHYMDLTKQGDSSLEERLAIMVHQKELLEAKKKEFDDSIALVDWKISFYQKAIHQGTEKELLADYLKRKEHIQSKEDIKK